MHHTALALMIISPLLSDDGHYFERKRSITSKAWTLPKFIEFASLFVNRLFERTRKSTGYATLYTSIVNSAVKLRPDVNRVVWARVTVIRRRKEDLGGRRGSGIIPCSYEESVKIFITMHVCFIKVRNMCNCVLFECSIECGPELKEWRTSISMEGYM